MEKIIDTACHFMTEITSQGFNLWLEQDLGALHLPIFYNTTENHRYYNQNVTRVEV